VHRRNTTVVLTVATVALVALAGCSGAGGSGTPYQTPLNATQVANGHVSALQNAGSFSVDLVVARNVGGRTATQNISAKVDVGTGAYSFTSSRPGTKQTTYVSPNGTAYVRTTANGTTSYSSGQSISSQNASTFIHPAPLRTATRLNYTTAGTTTVNGETVYRYVSHVGGNETGRAATGAVPASANATTELDIRPDGLVRRLSSSLHTSKGSLSVTLTYSHVGSTDPTPSWLSEAKAVSSNASASNAAT